MISIMKYVGSAYNKFPTNQRNNTPPEYYKTEYSNQNTNTVEYLSQNMGRKHFFHV